MIRFIAFCMIVLVTGCGQQADDERSTQDMPVYDGETVMIRNGELAGDVNGLEFSEWAEFLDVRINNENEMMFDVISYAHDRYVMARFWLELNGANLTQGTIFTGDNAHAVRCEGREVDRWTVDLQAEQVFAVVSESPQSIGYDRVSFRIDTANDRALIGHVDVHNSL